MKHSIVPFFLTLLFILSCTKPPHYPNEPVIKFNRLSKNTAKAGFGSQDSLLITFDFTDGDGDIGNEDNQINVQFKDLRDDSEFLTYSIPFIPVRGANNGISGEVSIILELGNPICCFTPEGIGDCFPPFLVEKDTMVYEIYILDRAGNRSNKILTDSIFLLCQS